MSLSLVSIIMPAYNAGQFIATSIETVLAQTCKQWELLIVDDGSVDDTKKIIENYCANDPRIKYFYHQNQKQGKTRNLALKHATGNFIAFLDADDLWVPNKLEKQLAFLEKFPEASVCFTNGCFFYNNDIHDIAEYDAAKGFFEGGEMYKLEYQGNYIPILSVLMKRAVVDKIGLQEERLFYQGCEDWDYWLRAAKAGAVFYGLEDKLFYYRRHENNMSSNDLAMRLAKACVFVKNFEKNRFTKAEIKGIFKPLIIPLVVELLLRHKIKEASYILRNAFNKIPVLSLKFSYPVFKLLGRYSMKPILKIDRLETMLIKH